MGRKLGYARVSTVDQNLNSQIDMILAAGVEERDLYVEKVSATKASRPQWDKLLAYAQAGDMIVAVRPDRIARNMRHMVNLVGDLDEAGIGLHFIALGLDTTTAVGKLLVMMMGWLAEMEHSLMVERTKEGLAAAVARGAKPGRPPKLTPGLISMAEAALGAGATVSEVARTLGVARTTLYRNLPSLKDQT